MKRLAAALLATAILLPACAKADSQSQAPEDAARADPAMTLLTSLTSPPQKGPFAPKDECGTKGPVGEFRLKLAQAVIDRDADALTALASKDIALDFGGGSGHDELKTRLDSKEYKLWDALQNMLPLGCALYEEGSFTVPWYFAQDLGERDPYMTLIVRGEGVPLLAEPRADAAKRKDLSWAAVELDDETDDGSAFAKVKDDEGTPGYVAWDKLRSVIDYRLVVGEVEGKWKITAFVAGD